MNVGTNLIGPWQPSRRLISNETGATSLQRKWCASTVSLKYPSIRLAKDSASSWDENVSSYKKKIKKIKQGYNKINQNWQITDLTVSLTMLLLSCLWMVTMENLMTRCVISLKSEKCVHLFSPGSYDASLLLGFFCFLLSLFDSCLSWLVHRSEQVLETNIWH